MLAAIVRYAEDTAGLEKVLRLLQGFCTIAVGLAEAGDVEIWTRTRSQFALGRRYFRLLKWHPCWSNAFAAMGQADRSPLTTAMDVAKWSFLGMYFFLEMFTISNAMGVTSYKWGPKVQLEANKCWFYALFFSIGLSLLELFFAVPPAPPPREDTMDGTVDEKPKSSDRSGAETGSDNTDTALTELIPTRNNKIYSQLVIDFCDLFIPGAAVGWIPVGPVFVGTASTISTSLAGLQIWKRVQQTRPNNR